MTQDKMNRKRALIVEDEPMICRVCQKTLVAEGFEVDIAFNGLVAKKLASQKSYDICLTDIRTPAMNGIELYEYLGKEHPDLARKVIFTTGDVLSGNIGAFLKEAGRPFLPKPFTPDELRKVVKEAQTQDIDSRTRLDLLGI